MTEPTREPSLIPEPDTDLSGTEEGALELQRDLETPRLPEDAQELVDATVGPDGVFELLKKEIRDIDDTVPPLGSMQELLDEADDRVAGFLIKETTKKRGKERVTEYRPRAHVEQLVKLATDETINGEVQELIVQLQDRLYSDIHGIMVRFHRQAEQKLPQGHPLREPAAIVDALSHGIVQTYDGSSQRVHTIFGVYRHMREVQQRSFEALDLTATEKPATISIVNPLSSDQSGYWMVQKKVSEQYREKKDRNPTLSQLIFEHSQRAMGAIEDRLTELDEKMTREGKLTEEEKKLYNAYLTLSKWISQEAVRFNRRMSDSELEFRAGLLFFGATDERTAKGGDVENFAELFNAAETVKQMDHELFERLAGVAPAHEQYRHGEVARSDLFGSVFQIALYNSLQMRDVNGYSKRIRGLTEIGTPQTRFLLLFSSVSDIEDLDRRIVASQGELMDHMRVDVQRAAAEGRGAATTVAIDASMIALMQSWREAAKVQIALASIESEKSHKLLERIRNERDPKAYMELMDDLPEYMYLGKDKKNNRQTKYEPAVREAAIEAGARLYGEARPDQFIALLRWMPYELLLADPVSATFKARSIEVQYFQYKEYVLAYSLRDRIGSHSSCNLRDIEEGHTYLYLEAVLWATSPDAAVLEDDGSEGGFFAFVEKLMASNNEESAEQLLYVAAGHREITDEQWEQWFEKCVERRTSGPLTRTKPAYEEIIDRWMKIFMQIRPTALLAGPASRFFCLQQAVGFYDPIKTRGDHFDRKGILGRKLRQDIEKKDQENCPQAEKIDLSRTFIGANSYGDRYQPYAYGLVSLSKEKYLAEREVILDPVKAAVVEFRSSTADRFVEQFHLKMMDLDKQMHLTARQLGEFVHLLQREEAELFLVTYFSSGTRYKIGNAVFHPFNPWQLEMLRLAEEFIPDDSNYRDLYGRISNRQLEDVIPKDPSRDRRFTYTQDQPTKGRPYPYENGEAGFLSPDGKVLRRPMNFCWPRYTQDEQGRWHAEWLDPETNEWQRFIEWDRYGVLEDKFMGLDANTALPINVEGREPLFLVYREARKDPQIRIVNRERQIVHELDIGSGYVLESCVLPNGTIVLNTTLNKGRVLLAYDSQTGEKVRDFPLPEYEDMGGDTHIRSLSDNRILITYQGSYPNRENLHKDFVIDLESGTIAPTDDTISGLVSGMERYKMSSPEHQFSKQYPRDESDRSHTQRTSAISTDRYVIFGADGNNPAGEIEVFDRHSKQLLWRQIAAQQPAVSVINDSQIAVSDWLRNRGIVIYDLGSGAKMGRVEVSANPQEVIPYSGHQFLVKTHSRIDVRRIVLVGERPIS